MANPADAPLSDLSPRTLKVVVISVVTLMLCFAGLAVWMERVVEPNVTLASQNAAPLDASSSMIYTTSFPDMQGKPQSLGQWQHQLLVINFWATWCAPCKEEMTIFAKLQKKYGANGLQIIGIASDSSLNVVKFEKAAPVGYPLLPDEERASAFSRRLGNRLGLLPHTVVVRAGGEIVFTQLGLINEASFEEMIQKNLPK